MTVYPENSNLVDVISSLPGILNVSSNYKDIKKDASDIWNGKLMIFFNVSKTDKGLFLLTRCCDNRYWKYGCNWKLELSVGDQFENNILPITYMLKCESIGMDAVIQSFDLVENMNEHLDHMVFLLGYDLDINMFIKSYNSFQRKQKLEKLKIIKLLESHKPTV